MKKFFAVLLCLALLITMTACKKPEEEPPLDESSELIKTAVEKMSAQPYKEVENKTMTYAVNGEIVGNAGSADTNVTWCDGSNFAGFLGESFDEAYIYYYNGSFYNVGNKEKCAVDFGTVDAYFASMGYDDVWFESFKFKEKTITENADGTTTLQGKKADVSAKEFISSVIGSSLPSGLGITIDYDTMEVTFVFDSQGRIIKHTWQYRVAFDLMGGSSAFSSTVETVHEIAYTYGEQYKVVLPADAGSYTAVDSFDDMYN